LKINGIESKAAAYGSEPFSDTQAPHSNHCSIERISQTPLAFLIIALRI
jgi:hypothetical protein